MRFLHLIRAAAPLSALAAIALVASATGSAVVSTTPAPAAFSVTNGLRMNSFETRLLNLVNQARAQRGIPKLIQVPGATDVARRWSAHMAGASSMSHNPALVSNLEHAGSMDWHFIAENVGMGPSNDPDLMFAAYMNSPHHRDNILDRRARYVGSGVVERPQRSGPPTAFHTMDFVDSYSGTYGSLRMAAFGLRPDAVVLPGSSLLATFETGADPRVETGSVGRVTASRATFDKVGPGDGAARFTVAEPYSATGGYAQLRVKDAYDFRRLAHVTVTIAATTSTGRPVYVTVSLGEPWSTAPNVILGTVRATSRPQSVTFTIPVAGRTYRNQILFSVAAGTITALSSSPSLRRANIAIHGVSATL